MSRAPRVRARLHRLPVRIRLVAGFVAAMTVLLCASGAFVYWRVRVDLDTELARELDDAATEVGALVGPSGTVSPEAAAGSAAARLHQVLAPDGTLRSHGADAGTAPLLTDAQRRAATDRTVHADRGALLFGGDRPLRVLARPIDAGGERLVLVVAVRRDQRDEALRELLAQLTVAGLLALAIAALIGERLAHAALAPVERFRAQAARLAADETRGRLEVPDDRDDEITRLGRTFNEVLDALERAAESERRFVDDASHELRTPLTRLRTRVQLLARGTRTVDEHRRGLDELARDLDELVHLADGLLDLRAAGLRPTSPAENATRPPRHHLRDALGGSLLDRAGIDASTVPEVDVAIASDDLRRILTNLLDNADVHGAPPITCDVRVADGAIVLEVHDAGAGIDPAFAPHATERFRRGPDAQNRPGSGLGLAIVAELVTRHGGTLQISTGASPDAATGGTTVRVSLPCTGPEVDAG